MRGTLDLQASSEATREVLPAPRTDDVEIIAIDLDRPGAIVRTEFGAWIATAEGLVLSASNEATRIITDISFEQLWPDENGVVGLSKTAESLVRIDESGVLCHRYPALSRCSRRMDFGSGPMGRPSMRCL